jgi:hypothetical protein
MGGIKNFFLMGLLLTSACGNKNSSSTSPMSKPQSPQHPIKPGEVAVKPISKEEISGQYLAVFKAVNPLLNEKVKGAMTFSKEGNEIIADVRLAKAFPKMVFAQALREGTECPEMSSDRNGDGLVDALEGEAVYGKILIPLDADLNTQASMARVYPLADEYGSYIYSKVASFESFLRDLKEEDPSSEDDYVKLAKNERLELEGKVVVIQGVPKDFILPESAQSTSGLSNHLTIPIACGKLKKVQETPGERYGNRVLRPASEVSPEDILPWSL